MPVGQLESSPEHLEWQLAAASAHEVPHQSPETGAGPGGEGAGAGGVGTGGGGAGGVLVHLVAHSDLSLIVPKGSL